MKEKQIGSGIGAGGISILAIFVVLCLATLAALSLVSARADRNLAEKNAQASVEYYQADARAEEILHELLTAVQSGPGWEEALRADGVAVVRQENAAVASYQVPINDSKSLSVEISLTFPGRAVLRENGNGCAGRLWWKRKANHRRVLLTYCDKERKLLWKQNRF